MDIQTQNSLKHFDTIQDYLLAAIKTLNHRRLDQTETLLGPWHANLCINFALHIVHYVAEWLFWIDINIKAQFQLYNKFV